MTVSRDFFRDMDEKQIDNMAVAYNSGFTAGQEHSLPSPETKENLELINKKMSSIETHLDYIKKSIDDNKDEHKEIFDILSGLPEKLDNRYASKTTERAVYAVIALIAMAVIGNVINSVVRKQPQLTEAQIIEIIDRNYVKDK